MPPMKEQRLRAVRALVTELFVSLEKHVPYPGACFACQKPGAGVWQIDSMTGDTQAATIGSGSFASGAGPADLAFDAGGAADTSPPDPEPGASAPQPSSRSALVEACSVWPMMRSGRRTVKRSLWTVV